MASDAFTADASPLASPWVAAFGNNLRATGGVCATITAGANACMRHSTSVVASCQVTITTVGDGDGGPTILDSSNNGYTLSNFDASTFHLAPLNAGVFGADIGTVAGNYVIGDLMRIRRNGTSVVVSKNGTDVLSVVNTTYTTGLGAAIFLFNSLQVDDMTDGDNTISPPIAWMVA